MPEVTRPDGTRIESPRCERFPARECRTRHGALL